MPPLVTTLLFMAGIGAFAAVVLAVAARFFSVPVDPRIEEVLSALPGVNCGACGYSGCAAAAAGVVKGECGPDVCLIGSAEVTAAVASVMNMEPTGKSQKRAFLMCSRNMTESGRLFTCSGPEDCRSAMMLYGGGKQCSGGCIGLGTCVTVCPVEAITLKNGLPVIDPVRCTGCGMCVKICPKKIIALVDTIPAAIEKKRCHEYCVQEEVRFEVDRDSCIKCGICFRNCPADAITWEKGTPALINKDRCIHCFTCLRVCPKKVIS